MLYPEIETYRRNSDTLDRIPDFRPSHLENYSQILAKGPAKTKEILYRLNSDIVPKKTCLFGYELNTKRILFIGGLFLLFFTSFFGFVMMWFTDFFDNTVLSSLAISNTSEHYNMWLKPSAKPLIHVYIFNYTNVDEFFGRGTPERKLRVKEVGPYVYEETLERVNVKFYNDHTVSFQEKRTYRFMSGLSKGRQSDKVYVPNIPVLSGAAVTKYSNYFTRLAFSSLLTSLDEKPFVNLAADSVIFGYDDHLYDFSKSLAKILSKKFPERLGLFSSKVGLQKNVITMYTGKDDISKLGIIKKLNGKEQLNYWSTNECNSIESADGIVYPPKQVQQKNSLSFLFPSMCRTIPLVFNEETTILDGKIPAYKYVMSDDIYASVNERPENQCYCSMTSGACPLKGVFNVTPCSFDSPMFISKPHFHNGDPSLLEGVEGLNAKKGGVQSYLNLHPIMGYTMTGRSVFQINIQVQKAFGMYQMDKLKDETILPIAWIDGILDEKTFPQDFIDLIYQSTYTLKGVKMAFKYGFLLTTLITLVCIVLVLKNKWGGVNRAGGRSSVSSRRILHGQQESTNLEEL